MTAFANARKFFDACEAPQGWGGCEPYVEAGAGFVAQSEPIADIDTVEAYCEWMKAFGTVTAAGATYDLHSASYDADSHYVYVLTMSENDKVSSMVKIWNAPWAMRELGWVD